MAVGRIGTVGARVMPSPVKDIALATVFGLIGGAVWKVYHLNERRKTEEFYSALEKGQITVIAKE